MKSKLFAVLFLAISNAFLLHAAELFFGKPSSAQFIYGKITTLDDEVYQGQIRWGDEEAFWFDMFNSEKEDNDNLKWLSRKEEQALNEKDGTYEGLFGKWGRTRWVSSSSHNHLFACQFGDIKSIDIHRGDHVTVNFKNGTHYELEGGSNDIETVVQISDDEIGVIKLDWDRIKKVEFMQAPFDMESAFGEPLYGIVKTIRGEFEGFLQWDHDERLTNDVLNGESEDGDLDIEFSKISSIKRIRRGSNVTLKSGRSFDLYGSNDVNNRNRGIIVSTPNYGRVDIPWDEFEEMIITDVPSSMELDYQAYRGSEQLRGTVETYGGESFRGRLIYDLDEEFGLEMLDGLNDDIEYMIPFSVIRSIEPKNRKESLIKLKNGEKFILEDKVDVNEDNDGLLVFEKPDKPHYIPWSDVKIITFE